MADIAPNILIITLNVKSLNTQVKKTEKWQDGHINKTQLYVVFKKLSSNMKT